MLHELFKNLLLHGGEGGDGASAAPGGETAAGAEETGVTTPDAGERTKRPNKAERRARVEAQLKAEAQERSQAVAQPQPEKRPFDEIEQLYHDEIGQKIQTAVTGRVKNLKDSEAELNSTKAELEKQSKLLAALAESRYGIKPGADGKIDIAAIEGKLKDDRVKEYAYDNGVSEEFAKERLDMEDKLEERDRQIEEQDRQLREFQAAEAQRQKDEADHARFLQHQEQAQAFREKMPGFDLIKEMEASPVFTRLINNGVGVESAYYAVHHKELMAVGQQAAAIQAQRALAASIQAGQSMPTEGGLGRSPAANPGSVVDPHTFTKEYRKELRRRQARGEKTYF